MSFDLVTLPKIPRQRRLNPFRTGRCLSTELQFQMTTRDKSQSLSNRAMSFDKDADEHMEAVDKSQSLSNRAMSFDLNLGELGLTQAVSIPFEQGDVFRQTMYMYSLLKLKVSIPFEQGDVFRLIYYYYYGDLLCVSIPFEQGDVFRLQRHVGSRNHAAFQTHFPIFLEG